MGFYVEGTRKGVQYRQVSRLDRVQFRQVSLYICKYKMKGMTVVVFLEY